MGISIELIAGLVVFMAVAFMVRRLFMRTRWDCRPLSVRSGVLAPSPPEQNPLRDQTPFEHLDCDIKPIARFRATVRVLKKTPYYHDQWAFISPVDFAVGWGPMSDSKVLEQFRIEHKLRWVYFKPKRAVRDWDPLRTARHIANLHLIPGNDEVADFMRLCRPGEVVSIIGYLVDVTDPYNAVWKTSISRSDLGGDACEIVWVKEIKTHGRAQASSRT